MYSIGILFFVTSIILLIFKKEESQDTDRLSLYESYKVIWKLLNLKPIQKTALILLTIKVF